MIKDFTELEIYRLAEGLALKIYEITKSFPKEEIYGLISQIRRAAVSIGANIAESFGRYHYKDRIQFLYHARGSLFEVRHFLILSFKLGYIKENEQDSFFKKIDKLGVKLNNYIKRTLERTT